MFTVAAFLPFLPMIIDAQIRQLGDDDFAKREAAMRFLEKALSERGGVSDYWALGKVKKRGRVANRYIHGHPFVFAVFTLDKEDQRSRESIDAAYRRFEKENRGGAVDGILWDRKHYFVGHFVDLKTLPLISKLKSHRNFKEFVPLDDAHDHVEMANSFYKKK
jgi:hypothetical protein